MPWNKAYCEDINLFVEGKILKSDATRQDATARAIIERLRVQPGIILADEVGMGKTFVALAVAVSVALSDEAQRPVVVMVPSSLKEKWPKDFEVFVEKCLPEHLGKKIQYATAESTVDFLKLLDDPPETRKKLIFLTHGAFLKNMSDNWLRLAFIQRALHNRKNISDLYSALKRYGPNLLFLQNKFNKEPDLFEKILYHKPYDWKKILVRSGVWEKDKDDPVPKQIVDAIYELPGNKFDGLYYQVVDSFPKRESEKLRDRLIEARDNINKALRPLWLLSMKKISHSLPLLVLDEAHHLKNRKTHFARLFHSEEDNERQSSAGQLENVFERMLFLTATPFQLGHAELCNVLERFNGINWTSAGSEELSKDTYAEEISRLRKVLDETQESALRFDAAWGALKQNDLVVNDIPSLDGVQWWRQINNSNTDDLKLLHRNIVDRYKALSSKMKNAEGFLKKYVIRHLRCRELFEPYKGTLRRNVINGCGIISTNLNKGGLVIDKESLLSFLLAARLSSLNPDKRPVFAEGLASSYEAFLNTRKKDWETDPLDLDEEYEVNRPETEKEADWYLSEIDALVKDPSMSIRHPKIGATIRKVLQLWEKGEKVLVFCHYIATGKALWLYISRAMRDWITERASQKLKCDPANAEEELIRLGSRFDEGYKLRSKFDDIIGAFIATYPELLAHKELLSNVILRYFRTPSFLVRFYPLGEEVDDDIVLEKSFKYSDASGLTLEQLILNFLFFLAKRCGEKERKRYLEALNSVQSGKIRMRTDPMNPDTLDIETQPENTLPNVRLVTGATKMETRQNLMLTFNTPFYPDVLIATSVMAEGVDLHLNCRFIIHHDLSWNPSILEQRTGRIDRIGAKVEQCGKSLEVYLPYVAATQDEKMYKVVMDRERWFNILMGEEYKDDLMTTEKIAERIPLPEEIVKELMFKLEAYKSNSPKQNLTS
jgi:superfamily II DNA or RNA helicase